MSVHADVSRTLRYDSQGLIPAVIQDWRDGTVLMVGFMSRESLEKTVQTGRVHFWSRSRKQLWEKGETSGNRLLVKDLFVDCDRDTLLVKVEPTGPTCHTGERGCFFAKLKESQPSGTTREADGGILEALQRRVLARKAAPASQSYVASLFQGGQDRILKKVAEEAGEVVLASKNHVERELVYEVADLLFHLIVVLEYHNVSLQDVYQELGNRFGTSGIRGQRADGATE